MGSKSPLNAANATMEALKSLRNFNDVAKRRGIALRDMLNQLARIEIININDVKQKRK